MAIDADAGAVRLRKLTLLLAGSLTVMAGATISPSLPALKAQFIAVPDADLLVRLVVTLPALFIALCAPLAGLVIDTVGRRRLIVAATLLYGLAGASGLVLDGLGAILIGRALLGVAVAGVMTTSITLIADYFKGDERARFMGLQSSFMAFGGVVFLLLGGALADLHWRGPFAVYLVALVLVPMMLAALPEPGSDAGAPAPGERVHGPPPLGLMALLYPLGLFQMAAFYTVPVQVPFYLQDMGIEGASAAGLAVAVSTLTAGILSLLYGPIRRVLTSPAIFALAYATVAVSFVILAGAERYPIVLLGLGLMGVGFGVTMPNFSIWLMAATPISLRGRIVGGLTTFFFLGQFLSPVYSQPLARLVGLGDMFLITGGLMGLLAAGFAVSVVLSPRKGLAAPIPANPSP